MASLATVRFRSWSSKVTIRLRPCSLARYIAVSASRTRLSAAVAAPRDRDPDAARDRQLQPPDLERGRERLQEPVGHGRGRVGARAALDEEHELVAAEASRELAVAQDRAEPPRRLQDHGVAGVVPEAVVDELEVIEVQEEDREAVRSRAGRAGAAFGARS